MELCKDDLIYNPWYINIIYLNFCKIQIKFVFKYEGIWNDFQDRLVNLTFI